MTRWTALAIYEGGDDIKCEVGGPCTEEGKFTGWIQLYRDGILHTPLLSSNPVFDDAESAKRAMEKIVADVRALSLDKLMSA